MTVYGLQHLWVLQDLLVVKSTNSTMSQDPCHSDKAAISANKQSTTAEWCLVRTFGGLRDLIGSVEYLLGVEWKKSLKIQVHFMKWKTENSPRIHSLLFMDVSSYFMILFNLLKYFPTSYYCLFHIMLWLIIAVASKIDSQHKEKRL